MPTSHQVRRLLDQRDDEGNRVWKIWKPWEWPSPQCPRLYSPGVVASTPGSPNLYEGPELDAVREGADPDERVWWCTITCRDKRTYRPLCKHLVAKAYNRQGLLRTLVRVRCDLPELQDSHDPVDLPQHAAVYPEGA